MEALEDRSTNLRCSDINDSKCHSEQNQYCMKDFEMFLTVNVHWCEIRKREREGRGVHVCMHV